ncbi:uncharacterized protein LY89DRAFT_725101 [Mollisia scopiformis]|uniref:Uncharacterized protein n=1 Tax=Mollisia scopiformis TaxID=149040 RepID=A0A132B6X6_MOLSC|nr:uncharacterized protein LY89DRAFT_725101 [Mollisia scopiformis]KUJ08165.1 hypothetical protein LY89DRAFT_725101 [Mollisia scopiformis]
MSEEGSVTSELQEESASEDATLKAIWDEQMKNVEQTGRSYRRTAVLMLSWAEDDNNLAFGNASELRELGKVFTNVLRYEVVQRQLFRDEHVEDGEMMQPTTPIQDRWTQIRNKATKRARRRLERTVGGDDEMASDSESESGGEETIESRVARIKARVAELTGNMEPNVHNAFRQRTRRGILPGTQLTKHLLEFVEGYDSSSSLLIVYYSGHGYPSTSGDLHLAPNRPPISAESAIRNAAAWRESEHIIADTEGDILLIFDCCHAGLFHISNVKSRPRYPTRRFECLLACGRQETTNLPGNNSFTSALIWSMKAFGDANLKYTMLELLAKITKDAPHFPKGQIAPVLELGGEPCDERITLVSQPAAPEVAVIDRPLQNYMDLRFWFPSRPTEKQIANLANRLRGLMLDKSINTRRILYRRIGTEQQLSLDKLEYILSWANGSPGLLNADMLSVTSLNTSTRDPETLRPYARLPSLLSLPLLEDEEIGIEYNEAEPERGVHMAEKGLQDSNELHTPAIADKLDDIASFKLFGNSLQTINALAENSNTRLALVGVVSMGLGVFVSWIF